MTECLFITPNRITALLKQLRRQTLRRSFSKDTFDEGGASMEAGGRIYPVLTGPLLPLMVSSQMSLTMDVLTQQCCMQKKG